MAKFLQKQKKMRLDFRQVLQHDLIIDRNPVEIFTDFESMVKNIFSSDRIAKF